MLKENGWNLEVKHKIEKIIKEGAHKNLPVVFDFDNTIIQSNDCINIDFVIEDNYVDVINKNNNYVLEKVITSEITKFDSYGLTNVHYLACNSNSFDDSINNSFKESIDDSINLLTPSKFDLLSATGFSLMNRYAPVENAWAPKPPGTRPISCGTLVPWNSNVYEPSGNVISLSIK